MASLLFTLIKNYLLEVIQVLILFLIMLIFQIKNISNSIGGEGIIILNADASEYILDDKSYFLFMFNPFDGFIMKKFIENNYNNLVKNKSVIAYSNYNQLDIIKSYTKDIEIIDQYKLAICYF